MDFAQNLPQRLHDVDDPDRLLDGVFENAPFGMQVYRADGRSVITNRAFRELFGSEPPPEYNVLDDAPDTACGIRALVRRAFSGEAVHTPAVWCTVQSLRPSPAAPTRRMAISASFFPLRAADESVAFVVAVYKDETAEVRARERVEGNERMVRQVVEGTSDLVFVKDREGRYLVANPASARVAGHAVDEILGHTDDEIFPPQQARALREADRRVMASDAGETYDEWFEVDGEIHYFSTAKTPYRAADGRAVGVIGISRDITERKNAEEGLAALAAQNQILLARARAEEHWLSVILERTPTPLVFVEPETARLYFANAAADRMAGGRLARPAHATEYAGCFDIRDLDDRPLPIDEIPMVRAARGQDVNGIQIRWHFPGGPKVLTAQAARLAGVDGHRETVLVAFEDVTALKTVQGELEEAVRVRQDFLSVAGHELKTPLTALWLNLRLIEQTLARRPEPATPSEPARPSMFDENARLGERWRGLQRQLARLNGLIDQLLDVSRLAAGKLTLELEPLELSEVVRDVVGRFAASTEAGIRLDLPDAGNPDAGTHGRWDRLRIEQVITNLVSNAVKYGAERPVRVGVRRQAEDVVIDVRDEGIGIAPEAQERIFDRFERAVSARQYGGLGLGLWIVRQLVEGMGGTISVESQVGHGSTFTVRLPLRPD